MRSLRSSVAVAGLGVLALASSAAAQPTPVSAPIREVAYTVGFTRATAAQRQFTVEMRFTVASDAPVLLSLPVWTPGAYEVTNFARWVLGFEVVDAAGRAVAWDKLDPDTWRVRPGGAGQLTVRFRYLATKLDTSEAWTTSDLGFFNGTNLFLYPEGRPAEWPSTVTITTEPDWKVATGLDAAGPARTYRASNYHELVDAPVMIGAFDLDSSTVAGKPFRLATYPAGSLAGAARDSVWSALRRMVPPQAAVFGEVPWAHYTLLQVATPDFPGASGLEHANSHLDVVAAQVVGNPFLNSLYSHEIFHAWNVKRLRPRELTPYRYDRWQPTTLLWVSEGITDYYADLMLVRGGVGDSTNVMSAVVDKMQQTDASPVTALEDASLSAYLLPEDGSRGVYYPKGALAGFALDILIRDASDNAAGLDDVMRALYDQTWRRGQGFSDEQWWAAVARAAGPQAPKLQRFRERYVDGRETFPWAEWLPLAGFALQVDSIAEPRLGVLTTSDSTGIRVEEVTPGGAAARAGVRPGDMLAVVGDIVVSDGTFGGRFRQKYRDVPEGTLLPLVVRRDGADVRLQMPLTLGVRTVTRVTADPRASPKAVRVRTGLLHGITGRAGAP
ncbi:MAG: hypothetical protein MUF53_06320 [Gemmatimonadaceae bacterium]|nr:hypothetical protein [Gemmatimonadaceae bacterium]